MKFVSKITFTCFCFLIGAVGFAQNDNNQSNHKTNNIKTNFLMPASIGYEKGFGDHLSLTLYVKYLPSLSFGKPAEELGVLSLDKPSFSYEIEARYYKAKLGVPLTDVYFSGYVFYREIDASSHKILTTSSSNDVTEIDATVTVPSSLTSGGLLIGWQTISKKNIVIDFFLGVGYYSFTNIPSFDFPDDSVWQFERLEKYAKRDQGITPRIGLSLGYAF